MSKNGRRQPALVGDRPDAPPSRLAGGRPALSIRPLARIAAGGVATALLLALAAPSALAGPAADRHGGAAARSSIRAGMTLSGTVTWRIATSGRVAAVEFWADNHRLGIDRKPPYRFSLNTNRLGNGVHALGWAVVRPDRSRVTPQVGRVTVRNRAVRRTHATQRVAKHATKHAAKGAAPATPVRRAKAARTGRITFRGDWETGNGSQWSSFECPKRSSQFTVERTRVRQGRYAGRFQVAPGDVWGGNDTIRCLAGGYDTGETVGDDDYYGFSIYVPSGYFDSNLIWELHHPASLYNLPSCGIAPFALHAQGSALDFRIATGNCTPGEGLSYWKPNIPIRGLAPFPRDRWIDFIVHIDFQESPTGVVQLWYRVGSGPWPAAPEVNVHGVPTMPYCDSCGVHDVHLYTELGLYTGGSTTGGTSVVYLDGYRRGTSFAVIKSGFPR